MKETIALEHFEFDLYRRSRKNINLSIDNRTGRVRVSAPKRTSKRDIKHFVLDHIDWIEEQLEKLPSPFHVATGERLSIWGKSRELEVTENASFDLVILEASKLIIYVTRRSNKINVLNTWLREQLQDQIPLLIEKWEPIVGEKVDEWRIKEMKTRWGTCNIQEKRIWINLELIKHPFICLDYVVLHEMTHLLEQSHNHIFKAYLDKFMPDWRRYDRYLNKVSIF